VNVSTLTTASSALSSMGLPLKCTNTHSEVRRCRSLPSTVNIRLYALQLYDMSYKWEILDRQSHRERQRIIRSSSGIQSGRQELKFHRNPTVRTPRRRPHGPGPAVVGPTSQHPPSSAPSSSAPPSSSPPVSAPPTLHSRFRPHRLLALGQLISVTPTASTPVG